MILNKNRSAKVQVFIEAMSEFPFNEKTSDSRTVTLLHESKSQKVSVQYDPGVDNSALMGIPFVILVEKGKQGCRKSAHSLNDCVQLLRDIFGEKSDSNSYLELLRSFPPRPIYTEEQFLATQEVVDALIDRAPLSVDESDYLNVLGELIWRYEETIREEEETDVDPILFLEAQIAELSTRVKRLEAQTDEAKIIEFFQGLMD